MARVVETGLAFVFVNQVCGQDELVFDGASFVLNPDRSLAVRDAVLRAALCADRVAPAEGRLVVPPQPLPPEPTARS